MALDDVLKFHMSQHDGAPQPTFVDLSLDGVPESKMNSKSMEVASLRFEGCRKVYPIRIGISERDSKKVTCEVIKKYIPGHSIKTLILYPKMHSWPLQIDSHIISTAVNVSLNIVEIVANANVIELSLFRNYCSHSLTNSLHWV